MMESPHSAVASLARFSAVSLDDLLHEISSESIAHVRLRENTVLDRLLAECNRQCVIFGAGTMVGARFQLCTVWASILSRLQITTKLCGENS